MPRSGPGNSPRRLACSGFTLIELLVVVALIAIASGFMTLALRDPSESQLEHEAARLAALLESARAESRASGIPVIWEPSGEELPGEGFRFHGVTNPRDFPNAWLTPGLAAEIIGARALTLGPEPLIGAQRIVLRLNDQRLVLATDGLGPFAVLGPEP